MNLLPLILTGLLGADQVIDTFQYADDRAARSIWTASEGTPPVERIGSDSAGLRMAVPFASREKLLRTVIDRRVRLDLAAPGEFTLDVVCPRPEAIAQLTLYFRSGAGWYGSGRSLTKVGPATLRFSKAAFRAEGKPTGWHAIDGIRIAAWRSRAVDTSLDIHRLTAVSREVALVVPDASSRPDDAEVKSAMQTAELLSGMLAELGLGADAVDEKAITRGALGNRRVAILAYNPRLGGEAITALEQFVERGGKLLVCYQLPRRLGTLLGFSSPKYTRQSRSGHFAEIRFDAPDIDGLPPSVKQASWNITTAEPAAYNARVIGRWYNDTGKPTGDAAMLISDRGAFFSHTVLGDDRPGKRQMLAAVLGYLAEPLWQQVAETAVERAGQVGHCSDLAALQQYIRASGNNEAMRRFVYFQELLASTEQRMAKKEYAEVHRLASRIHDSLAHAYLLAQPSPKREGRAFWNHSGTGAYPGDWDRSAKELADAGFNMILPNMLWGGRAHYASNVLPRSSTFEKYGDQIEQCTAAAKKYGLEVHVWKVNYNLSGAPREFVEKLRREKRLQVTVRGETHPWLCPSHPANKKLELESLLEVAREYPVDGLHFDYIRYPGRDQCYCEGCRERFEAASERKVRDWPADCYSGARREGYNDWRCRQIGELVESVHREAKRIRPEIDISAAVFGSYPACRDSVAQDWPKWVKAGWLDFICPMDYTESDLFFSNLVENQLELVGGRIPIYPGIGATASNSALSIDRVVGQIHHARRLGAAGFTIFNFSRGTAESLLPGLSQGVGRERAVPLHSGR